MDAESPLLRFRLWYAALPRALRLLMTVNTVLYLAVLVLQLVPSVGALVVRTLALTPLVPDVLFRPWQVLTYGVLNVGTTFWGFLSFLFAMLWLYWMGREYEEVYGAHRLFGLYVLVTLAGALVALLFFGVRAAPEGGLRMAPLLAGAFGPALGVLCAVAALHPNRGLGLLFLGVVPLKWVAAGFVLLDLVFSFDPTHLGAALMGVVFGRAQHGGLDLAAWARPLFVHRRAPSRTASRAARSPEPTAPTRSWFGRGAGEAEAPPRSGGMPRRARREGRPAPPAPTGSADVDRILDKILEHGFESLTDEEKRILDEASRS